MTSVAPGTPLYVHLPFCVRKCSYCDFYSVVAEGQDIDGVLDALLHELRLRAPERPRTVFLGGGTPSFFSVDQLARFFDELERCTGFRTASEEVTVECNPESLDADKARALFELGANRLSIGVQSLRPEILELFDRPHRVEDSWVAWEAARAAGFQRLSLDVIYAVPGQDLAQWERDVATLLAHGPRHVSAYNLAFEEGTRFTRWLAEGRLEALPEELELAFFESTRRLLAEAGLEAYEVSNFALTGHECRHNLNYWANGDYVGIGPSAASKLGRTRFGNARSLSSWRAAVAGASSGLASPDWSETLTPPKSLGETWWLGLRTRRGVSAHAARATAEWSGSDANDPALALARELAAQGWLTQQPAGGWTLTERGLPVADAIARRFLDVEESVRAPVEARE